MVTATLNPAMSLLLPSSNLQVTVATALDAFRRLYLQQALSQMIEKLNLSDLNAELDSFVPPDDLKRLASRSIRGEFLFPVPCLLTANPRSLGYYRLLRGFSQKEFFNKGKLGWYQGLGPARNRPADGVNRTIRLTASAGSTD